MLLPSQQIQSSTSVTILREKAFFQSCIDRYITYNFSYKKQVDSMSQNKLNNNSTEINKVNQSMLKSDENWSLQPPLDKYAYFNLEKKQTIGSKFSSFLTQNRFEHKQYTNKLKKLCFISNHIKKNTSRRNRVQNYAKFNPIKEQ